MPQKISLFRAQPPDLLPAAPKMDLLFLFPRSGDRSPYNLSFISAPLSSPAVPFLLRCNSPCSLSDFFPWVLPRPTKLWKLKGSRGKSEIISPLLSSIVAGSLPCLELLLKCSIDSLLDRTVEHMLFLQSVTKYADKLKQVDEPKAVQGEQSAVGKDKRDKQQKDKRLILTMEDLSKALREYGVNLKHQEYYADSPSTGMDPSSRDE